MARFILTTVLFVLFAMPVMAKDKEGTTSDPKFQPNAFLPVTWVDYKTPCRKCERLAKSYNEAMQALMNARHEYAGLGLQIRQGDLNARNAGGHIERRMGDREGLDADVLDSLGQVTAVREALQSLRSNLSSLRGAIENLELSTEAMRQQIAECEKQCKTSEADEDLGALGVPPSSKGIQLPFDWKGPYSEVCEKCAKLATRLNNLPGAAMANLAELDAAEAERIIAEIEIKILHTNAPSSHDDPDALRRMQKALKEAEERLKALKKRIKKLEFAYDGYIKNFKETLVEYNKCIKTCKDAEEPKKVGCFFPEDRPAIAIGPNSEVGSGAALMDKIESKAKGAAMGALGGMLGGSGISLGGGGGDSGSKEPKTDKDPTSGAFTSVSSGGTALDMRAGFTNEGLVVSTEIDDAPGNGTFHAQWLEDGQGKIYLPRRYLLIDIYRDWKLSVWWTYDRWVNGDHVEHDEGDSMTVGTDYIGTLAFFEGAKGIANSIWKSMGFETAVKGVKHLGAVFDVPPSALEGPCPMQLVTHISQPKTDPVMTVPVVGSLFRNEQLGENNTSVLIRPVVDDTPR